MVYKIEGIFKNNMKSHQKEEWKGHYKIELLEVGQRAVFERYDESKIKTLTTSIVEKVLYDGQDMLVFTKNTVYYLHCCYQQVKEAK